MPATPHDRDLGVLASHSSGKQIVSTVAALRCRVATVSMRPLSRLFWASLGTYFIGLVLASGVDRIRLVLRLCHNPGSPRNERFRYSYSLIITC